MPPDRNCCGTLLSIQKSVIDTFFHRQNFFDKNKIDRKVTHLKDPLDDVFRPGIGDGAKSITDDKANQCSTEHVVYHVISILHGYQLGVLPQELSYVETHRVAGRHHYVHEFALFWSQINFLHRFRMSCEESKWFVPTLGSNFPSKYINMRIDNETPMAIPLT